MSCHFKFLPANIFARKLIWKCNSVFWTLEDNALNKWILGVDTFRSTLAILNTVLLFLIDHFKSCVGPHSLCYASEPSKIVMRFHWTNPKHFYQFSLMDIVGDSKTLSIVRNPMLICLTVNLLVGPAFITLPALFIGYCWSSTGDFLLCIMWCSHAYIILNIPDTCVFTSE